MNNAALRVGIIVGLVVISAASAWFATRNSDDESLSNRLAVEVPIFDFGEVAQGEKRKHVFDLRNVGNKTINIANVQSSCGCTVAGYDKSNIQPRDHAPLALTFDTGEAHGRVHVRCAVFYFVGDDKRLQVLDLKLVATVHSDLEVIPNPISFDWPKDRAQADSQLVTVTSNRLKEFQVSEAKCTHPAFTAEVLPQNGKDRNVYLRIRFDSNRWLGHARMSELLIFTNGIRQPVIHVPLSGPAPKDPAEGPQAALLNIPQ
jgi:hypothetical protein